MSKQRRIEIAAAIADMKTEILADIAAGIVPASVSTFSELHDYVDANTYAGFCDGSRETWETDRLNLVQSAVNVWLENGRNGAAAPVS